MLKLDLSGNQLTDLPKDLFWMARLSRLTHLDLSDNQLTGLPDALLQLDQLTELNLSGNQLTAEQAARGPRRPIRLDLSGNQLAEIPPVLTRKRLKVQDLSHNQLTDFHMDRGQVSNLTHNRLTDLSLDLVQLEHLTHLDLGHNQFSEIPPVLSRLRSLLSLDLRGKPLTKCLLPLPWQIDRYIYSPFDFIIDSDQRFLDPMISTEHPDLPFLELCLE